MIFVFQFFINLKNTMACVVRGKFTLFTSFTFLMPQKAQIPAKNSNY